MQEDEVRDVTGLLKLVTEAALINLEKAGVRGGDAVLRPSVRIVAGEFAQRAIQAAKHPVRDAYFNRAELEALVPIDAKTPKEIHHAVVCAFMGSDFLTTAQETTWLFRAFGHVYSLATVDGQLHAHHVCL